MRKIYAFLAISGLAFLIWNDIFITRQVSTVSSEFTVNGRCTLGKWSLSSDQATAQAQIEIGENKVEDVTSLSMTLPTASLKSGNPIMNNHARDALEPEKYPNITFMITQIKDITHQNNQAIITALGDLTIGEVTKEVTVEATGKINGGTVTFEGSRLMKMTDYNIQPPVFWLGTVTSEDEITVNYRLDFPLSPL